jgi:S1-C subfamily serine protease
MVRTQNSNRRDLKPRRVLARATAGALAALALVLVLVFGFAGCDWGGAATAAPGAPSTTTTTGGPGVSASVVSGGDGLVSPAAAVARVLGPSVVNIRCTGAQGVPDYFQAPGQQQFSTEWEGSGVIYSADGKIITNNHVVTGGSATPATDIEVTLATGEKLKAAVVGTDPLTDLAVIKVTAGFDLPAATFATDLPVLGEYVVALGSPDGFENSVNLGIVSGLDRTVEVQDAGGTTLYTDLVQTDAGISSGNSGGALANVKGQVVGVPSVAVQSVQVENIGFAIPSALVVRIADEIIATGKATHAYVGVSTRTVDEALRQQFSLSRSSGILVADLATDGPAAKAGVQQGDIIVKVGSEEMIQSNDLLAAIRDKKPGDKVEVTIDRKGETKVITVTLEERPTNY